MMSETFLRTTLDDNLDSSRFIEPGVSRTSEKLGLHGL